MAASKQCSGKGPGPDPLRLRHVLQIHQLQDAWLVVQPGLWLHTSVTCADKQGSIEAYIQISGELFREASRSIACVGRACENKR